MPVIKIKNREEMLRTGKKAHKQISSASAKVKTAKREISAARRKFDEKVPAGVSDEDRQAYEKVAAEIRRWFDTEVKPAISEAEQTLSQYHKLLNELMR